MVSVTLFARWRLCICSMFSHYCLILDTMFYISGFFLRYTQSYAADVPETIGALSHRLIVLTDAVDYRTIGFSHNRPNPT